MAKTSKPSLAETHPELAAQADGWDPSTLTRGSHKKVGWICFFGHCWKSEIKSRALLNAGCPYCDGKLPVTGKNDLKTLYPDIAAQARGWDPSTVSPNSHKKREFECENGHRYLQAVRRRIEATACPVCQNDQVIIGVNDLDTTHPQLAKEADGWDSKTVVAGTPTKKPWRCSRGHRWIISVNARAIRGTGCPYCSGRHPIVGETDLATTHPHIASQLVDVDPQTIKAGTNKKIEWVCDRGHKWFATPNQRTGFTTGCPYCSGVKVIKGETDLSTTHPDLAAQARGWDPSEYSRGSDKRVRWECKKKHQWDSIISSRVSGVGCPFCSGRLVTVGETDLATLFPGIAKEAVDWDPKTAGIGDRKKRLWKCPIGHIYMASIDNRTYMGSGCSYCSNKAVLAGFNDLSTTHPEIAAEAFGWDPTTVTAGSNKKRKWKCEKEHVWTAVVGSRAKGSQARSKASGCPSCARFGFKPDSKAWLYFLEHSEMDLFQIGIANDIQRRLEKHEAAGWKIVEVRGPMEGNLTKSLEAASLIAIRNRGGVIAKDIKLKKFDGYTEAWTKKSLNVTSIKQILDWVYEDESKGNHGAV